MNELLENVGGDYYPEEEKDHFGQSTVTDGAQLFEEIYNECILFQKIYEASCKID